MIEKVLITVAEAAEMLGFTTRTLQAWRLAGKGPRAYRITNKGVRYDLSDILSWIESKEINQQQQGETNEFE